MDWVPAAKAKAAADTDDALHNTTFANLSAIVAIISPTDVAHRQAAYAVYVQDFRLTIDPAYSVGLGEGKRKVEYMQVGFVKKVKTER